MRFSVLVIGALSNPVQSIAGAKGNGGDIRGIVCANEAFLRLAGADTKIVSSRGIGVAGRLQVYDRPGRSA